MADFLDKENLEKDLDKFFSSFDVNFTSLTKARVETLIKKLNDDREHTTKSEDEDIKITNFLSYLYFLLEDHEHALQLVEESLQKDPDNIIANANKARILLETGEVSDVEEIISKLQELEKRNDYEKRKCYAEADLAYACSRSGPWYHQRAVDMFSRIVEKYPTVYAWQFGLGLTLYRQTHDFISLSDDSFNSKQKEKKIVRVAQLFLCVATQSDDAILCAKAYARLGKVVHDIQKNRDWNVPQNIKELDYKSCYEKAVAKCPEEPSVLHICGRLARYKGEIDVSERFLRKSIEINPSCQGYHHLALTLKRKVEMGRGNINKSHLRPRYHQESTNKLVTTVDNSLDHQTTERKKPGSRSGRGRGQFHEDRYRPQFGTHNDPSQWNRQEPRGGRRQMGRRPYHSHGYGNGDFNYWSSNNFENWKGGYNYSACGSYTYTGGMDGNAYDFNVGYVYGGITNTDCWDGNGTFKGGWHSGRNLNDGWHGNGGRQWRKESNNNSYLDRHNTGRNSSRKDSGGRYNTNRNVQTKEVSQDCLPDQSKKGKQQNLRRVINSPLKVQVDPENQLLVEAIELLEKTKELTQHALNIEYDKGIIYRMLGQTGKAVDVFKQIVSKRKYLPTPTLMTNVYEQLGLCLLELSESEEIPPDVKQKHKRDGHAHLDSAVQLQSGIVAKDPDFKDGWHSYSTLKELWSDKRDGKPKQLAILHMRMGDHGESIAIYKELSSTEKGYTDPDDCKNMLECYMKLGQFEKCVALLSSWECTTIFARLPDSLVFEVYINGAFHAHSTDNAQLAYKHFRCAFQVYSMFGKAIDQTEAEEEDDKKEILILHSCSQGWRCRFPNDLGTILEDCTGLRYTINTDNVLGNAITTESMVSMMQQISCIIIMTHDSADKYDRIYVNLAVQMSSERGGPKVLVVSDDKSNVPDVARTMPFIQMPPLLDDNTTRTPPALEGAKQIEWMREFISLLKDQHQ